MPSHVQIYPPPDCLPHGWERPNKPDPWKCCILRFTFGLNYPNACYWGGYAENTAIGRPRAFMSTPEAQKYIKEHGISTEIIKNETISDTDAKMLILEACLRQAVDIPERVMVLREFREYLRFRCQVGGVPLNHTVVTGGKDTEGSDKAIEIIIKYGAKEAE